MDGLRQRGVPRAAETSGRNLRVMDGLRQCGVPRAAETSGRNLRVMDVLSVGLESTEGLSSGRRSRPDGGAHAGHS